MSLAQEIAQLFELHKAGALSAEEFTVAKAEAMRHFAFRTTAAAGASASAPVEAVRDTAAEEEFTGNRAKSTGSRPATPCRSLAVMQEVGEQDRVRPQSLLLRAAQGVGDAYREQFLDLLQRILQNLVNHPQVPRYTQLRTTNAAIAELLRVPGVQEVLTACGFRSSHDGEKLVWTARNCPPGMVQETLAAVGYVKERESTMAGNRHEVERLRRSIIFEIRLENARKAQAAGELEGFLVTAYASDEVGDGLSSSLQHLQLVGTLLDNARQHAGESRYRSVRLENPLIYDAVVRQKGGLEFVLLAAGGILEERNGEVRLYFADLAVLDSACAMLTQLKAAVESIQQERAEETRRVAEAAARLEQQRERQRLVHQQARTEESSHGSEARERAAQRVKSEGDGAPPSSQCSGEAETEKQKPHGNRVSLVEALAMLMGKGCPAPRAVP